MKHAALFSRYIQLADLLGQMFPHVLEVVVHDFTDLDHAVIHIVNGHLSGRSVGDPISEINLRRLLEQGQFPDLLLNFSSRSQRGQPLRSSSLAIRDDAGKLIGACCFHFDLSHFEQFQTFLSFFLQTRVDSFVGVNDFGKKQPQDQEIQEEIDTWMLKHNLHAAQLTYQDKQAIVGDLYTRGWFKRKGAVSHVAHALQLTRQSVYNYLNIAKG